MSKEKSAKNQISSGKVLVNDFTSGNVTGRLIKFATPLFLGNMLQVVYNMVDMMIVGNVIGKAGLSAVSIGGDLNNLLTFIAMGFTNAGTIIISQYIGAGQRRNVGRFIGTFTLSLTSFALVMTVIAALLHVKILEWMNTPTEAYSEAKIYCLTCILGLFFIYGYNAVSGILRGMGDSKHPFIFIAIAAALNIILDCVFVIGLRTGAFGAALATVISQGFSFMAAVVFLARNRARLGFEIDRSCFVIDRTMFMTMLKLGIPMALKSTSVAFSKMFVNSYINSFGVTVSAVAGIGSKLNHMMAQCSNAFNTAGAAMVGQNIGAEKYERVPKILISDFSIMAVVGVFCSVALVLFPNQIFCLFTSDPDVLKVCMEFIPVAVVIFVGSAFRAPANALANGTGNYVVNFAVALLDAIVLRIGLALLLGITFGMGYLGFWYGDALAGFTPFVIGSIFYLSGKWKTNKYVIKK
ncbi:MAG: MATE family efflux transporter [Firmicutes bacterium]|nr:MATE family efflux transporter [Bacillota bacterium]